MVCRANRRSDSARQGCAGIDPHARIHRPDRRPLRRYVVGAVFCLTLAGAVTVGSATPAQSDGTYLTSGRSIDPPAGFRGICARYDWVCARRSANARSMTDPERIALARGVNSHVNRTVREISDRRQYRKAEHWALPTARGGDCEDFALMKKHELIRRGVAPERLLSATALTKKRVPHAVLILRTGTGDLVLDNLTDRIRPWRETDHSYLRIQDPQDPRRWQMLLAGGMFGKRVRGPGV